MGYNPFSLNHLHFPSSCFIVFRGKGLSPPWLSLFLGIFLCDFKSLHSLVQFHHSSFPLYSLCSRPYWISFSFPNLPCCLSDLWAPVHSIPSPRTFFQDFYLLSAHLVSVWPCFLQEVLPDCSRLGYMSLMCSLLWSSMKFTENARTALHTGYLSCRTEVTRSGAKYALPITIQQGPRTAASTE